MKPLDPIGPPSTTADACNCVCYTICVCAPHWAAGLWQDGADMARVQESGLALGGFLPE